MPSLTGRLEGAVSRNLLHVASQDSGSPKLEKQAPGVWGHAGQFSELKLAVPWGHIAAKAWGSQQGPPVLCLHGWLDNANSFDRLIPLLSKDFHYVAMDFGGHGLSSHYSPGLPYYHQNFVSEVRRVAAALKWSRFSLIGHSFGGLVGGMFSCVFPEMVDKLILLDATPFFLDTNEIENLLTYKRRNTEHTLQVEASKKPSKVVSQEAMLQGFLKNNSHVGEECGALLLQRGTTQVATGLVLNRDRRIAKIEHCLDFVSKELFEHYIRKLQARVLLIKATQGYHDVRRENDANTEPMLFKIGMLRAVLKERFQFVEVTGNHYVHMNQPQLVASVINSFLQSKERIPAQL
ncbi:serine hydrolase-like protein 2 isoform X1 [Camelus ferus]|uniref:Serine hydrolase-like protein 2 isoform X1 n=1 Tax=Camelus ferus TaxID=419612 RepID=A0A8B6Y6H7_CAMFR|nr:serine hydrolase-like protein 2 isoform X1 [Camelus ferus]XP_045376550.1 serine hydrolase-like protein 2 isoform X1 [Camelus bactrianus]